MGRLPLVLAGCLLFLAGDLPVAAQRAPRDPLAMLGGQWSPTLEPAGGVVAGDAEMRISGGLHWFPVASDRSPLELALWAHGVRGGDRSWAGAEVAGRRVWGGSRRSVWLSLGAIAGSGDGAAWAVIQSLGAGVGAVRLELRSAWIAGPQPGTVVIDTLLPRGYTVDARRSRYTDAELRAGRSIGTVRLEANAGIRFGSHLDDDRWLGASLVLPVHARAELVAAGGRRPERPERGEIAGAFFTLGVRLVTGVAPARPELPLRDPPSAGAGGSVLDVRRGAGRSWILSVRRDAALIEIRGDLTGWAPLALEPVPGEAAMHRVTIQADPGVYHVVMRADGGPWRPPAGMPDVPDGFGGRSGLLVLR